MQYRTRRPGIKLLAPGRCLEYARRTMARPTEGAKKDAGFQRVVARNKRARHDFEIEETFEAGIELQGSEVKSLRGGKGSIREAWGRVRDGQALLVGMHIPEYVFAHQFNHEPLRPRRLLLHAHELRRLENKTQRAGYTLVALELYFNEKGRVKVLLGLAHGRRRPDKRQALKQAEADREMGRILKSALGSRR